MGLNRKKCVIHRLSEKNYQYKRMKQLLPVLKKGIEPVYNLGLSHCLASLRGSKWKIVPLNEKWICTNLLLAKMPHICKNSEE